MKIRLSNNQKKICIQLIILGLNVCLFSNRSNAQIKVDTTLNTIQSSIAKDSTKIYLNPERAPEFPGGEYELMRYLSNTIRYPSAARDSLIQGRVTVEFQVCADGKLCDLRITKSVNEDLDKEAMRAIKNMPTWIPAKDNGKNVPTYFSIPIIFKLD